MDAEVYMTKEAKHKLKAEKYKMLAKSQTEQIIVKKLNLAKS